MTNPSADNPSGQPLGLPLNGQLGQASEALRLAEWIESDMTCQGDAEIAAELRRQHAEIERLKAALLDIGEWDVQGVLVASAWDHCCGPGAWAGLVGPNAKVTRAQRPAQE